MVVIDRKTILDLISQHQLISHMVDPKVQVSPNGVELTLQKLYTFQEAGTIDFSNQERYIPEYEEVPLKKGQYVLQSGTYLVTYNEIVRIPTNLIAIGRPRSSLLRSGVTIESAVWDAGYEGRSRGILTVYNPITGIWLRALFFLVMGIILIVESFLVRREVVKTDHGLNADTVGPVILKFTAIFALAWGSYQMAWVLVPYLRGVPLVSMIPLFLSALGFIIVSVLLLIYVETQNRQPHFRYRRFPLLMSFLLLLMIFPVTTFYIVVYIEFANLELLFNAIIGLAVSLTILTTSFYIVYHPTKAR